MIGRGVCTVVVTTATLLKPLGSAERLLTETELVAVPARVGRTVIRTKAPPLGGSVPKAQLTEPPAELHEPRVEVMPTTVMPGGNVSVSVARGAVRAVRLVTTMV